MAHHHGRNRIIRNRYQRKLDLDYIFCGLVFWILNLDRVFPFFSCTLDHLIITRTETRLKDVDGLLVEERKRDGCDQGCYWRCVADVYVGFQRIDARTVHHSDRKCNWASWPPALAFSLHHHFPCLLPCLCLHPHRRRLGWGQLQPHWHCLFLCCRRWSRHPLLHGPTLSCSGSFNFNFNFPIPIIRPALLTCVLCLLDHTLNSSLFDLDRLWVLWVELWPLMKSCPLSTSTCLEGLP